MSKRKHFDKNVQMRIDKRQQCKTISDKYDSFDKIRRGCVSKRRFASRKAAKQAARKLGYRIYRCPFCGKWHLTKCKGGIYV